MNSIRALISLTRYDEPAWLVKMTLDSLATQSGAGYLVYLFDQTSDPLLRDTVQRLSSTRLPMIYETIPARTLSFARNCAIEAAKQAEAEIVLYIDPDAVAEPDWASRLCAALEETPEAGLVGGRILPRWKTGRPMLAKARFVADQFSLLDLGEARCSYHRVVGAGFGIHRSRLGAEASFDETLGRRDGRLFSGEESELCARATAVGLSVIYEGRALVHHQIMPERARTKWIIQRFYFAGWSRAGVGGAPSPSRRPSGIEWMAAAFLAVPYLIGYLSALWGRRTRQS